MRKLTQDELVFCEVLYRLSGIVKLSMDDLQGILEYTAILSNIGLENQYLFRDCTDQWSRIKWKSVEETKKQYKEYLTKSMPDESEQADTAISELMKI